MPKDRYRLYHREKALGGVGLTMIGGSAVIAPDSPPSFGNLLLYKDEIVPWLRRLTEDVHDAGAAVMCQVTHLGRRTSNFSGDWLPLVYPSPLREPAHRSFPKAAEPWDLDRIVDDYVAAAERCAAAGLDGIELQSYGHFLDAFLSPATNTAPRRARRHPRSPDGIPPAGRTCGPGSRGPDFVVGIRMSMDEDSPEGLGREEALRALSAYVDDGIDFLSSSRERSRATRPCRGSSPRWARRGSVPGVRRRDQACGQDPGDARLPDLGRRHGTTRTPRRTARPGRDDARADRRPAPGRQGGGRATRTGSARASARTTASTRSTSPGTPSASTTRRRAASRP